MLNLRKTGRKAATAAAIVRAQGGGGGGGAGKSSSPLAQVRALTNNFGNSVKAITVEAASP